MLADHLRRGALAGVAGGVVFGLYQALLGRNLVALAEGFEGADHAAGTSLAGLASVAAGVVWGVLLGVVAFGVVFYLVEPAIPGPASLRSYVLGAAGFVTVSGAPWLVLPPQPPGVEAALPTGTRLGWYAAMVLAGALACGLAGWGATRLRARDPRGGLLVVAAVAAVALPAVLAPANPTAGPAPAELVWTFRWASAFGQAGLWFVTASAHATMTPPGGVAAESTDAEPGAAS